ncbi:zinc finger, CCHC-type containing protein [Tanacetum coccineum]|uniref:Zinc finger, CCHC-type containing protein n=1 Tax=Tanacetum coccineum TaxID=301880 RepID=A0ABQ4ZU15_9ASTR
MDVNIAFLNVELDEEVYINQPQGFIMPGNENKVIGCLMYAMTCTRSDIVFVVGKLSSAAILAKAYSQMYNGKSRHLGVRHSMIREFIMNEVVSIEFLRSQQNLADHLMKELARDLVLKSIEWIGLKSNLVTEC